MMFKSMIDYASLGIVLASMMSILPPIAALLTIIWTGLRIYESWLDIKEKHKDARKDV